MLTRTYDASGNVLERSYSGGLAITYTYDEDINRLLTADGLGFTYDEVGNVMATTNQGGVIFGATHDDGGRLASLTYADGAFTVSYTYDPVTGLLNQVRDDLTGTEIGFTYDADRRLVGITRPNGVNSIHSWDNANRLVRVQHGSYADLQYTFDGAGQVTQVQMSVPLDPGAVLTAGSRSFTYDDASQVSSPGYQYDARGRRTADLDHTYAWDSAGRLTQLNGVTFTYDGLNDPISRTEGNDTTTFYYNYAVSLHPIMAERRGMEGEWLHYYVYTPEGRLLYMIAAQDSNGRFFYHFDRSGNTLFLTDETGGVTDAYAYTPYGELFAHDGSNPQPFTFQGEWGVRMEESTLFDMRARYYDARTASFLTRDPIWPVLEGPRALNPYQYGFQNPMRYSDVTGLYPSRPSPDDQYEEMIRTILENAEDLLDDFIPSSETNGTDNGDDGDDGGFWSLADQILERDARLGRISLEVTTSSAFGDSFWHLATGSIVEEVLVNGSYQPLGSGERFGVMATDPESLALIERERAFQGIPADPTLGGTHYSVIVGGDQDRVVVSIRDNFTGSIIGSNQITIDSLSAGSPQLPDGTHRSYERNEVLDAFGRATADLVRGLLR